MQWLALILGGGAGAVLAALVQWSLGRRQTSGKLDTSAPAELWAEGKAIREEYKARVAELRAELAEVKADAARDRARIFELEETVLRLTAELRASQHGRG